MTAAQTKRIDICFRGIRRQQIILQKQRRQFEKKLLKFILDRFRVEVLHTGIGMLLHASMNSIILKEYRMFTTKENLTMYMGVHGSFACYIREKISEKCRPAVFTNISSLAVWYFCWIWKWFWQFEHQKSSASTSHNYSFRRALLSKAKDSY